jgi:anti-sigma-K factor RskA
MDKEREIMHKILDGDAGDEEKRTIIRDMEADPGLKEEFIGLENAVRVLETSERMEAPPAFTAEVMKQLTRKAPSLLGRMRGFLLGSRVLRWNMAAALAAAVIVLVTIVTVSRMHREPVEPAMTALSVPESMTGKPVTGEPSITVRLTFHAPQAHSVAVAGKFNKWRIDDEMKGIEGTWSIDLKLKPGVYTYSFLVDGKSWVPDPGAESYEDDGFGSQNAVLRVNT